jgi:poly(3-hydroxybutyrate) depolymerase
MLRSALACAMAAFAVQAATTETFDQAYQRLRQGRTYTAQPTGLVRMSNRSNGVEHHFAVNVPDTYDPAKKYQLRIQLHGGVGGRRDSQPVGTGLIGALAGVEQIYVIPYAWSRSPWWSDDQVDNLHAIVDAVKQRYNVDENRVVVSGASDGGTGAYYVAMRDTTPYASFLPLNGYWMVLASRDVDDGEIFANNLRNKPLFIVNGGRDPLYPTRIVDPYVEHYKKGGVELEYHPQPEAGHNTQWWPTVRDSFEAFVRAHPRQPLPDTLTWETSDISKHNRAHWLVIDRIGPVKNDAKSLADLNEMAIGPAPDFGVRSNGTRINRVMPGSNADKIGLKDGDVLVRLNDETVRAGTDVQDALEDVEPGAHIELLVARNNLPVEISGTYEPALVTGPPRKLFARSGRSGRVDLARTGNVVEASTHGVTAFTLLLSPDQFDFAKPVKVIANGRTVFDGRVRKDVRTLTKWAAIDHDRTMLFGAEIRIDLSK